MFKSKKEFARALEEGGEYKTPRGFFCFYDAEADGSPYRIRYAGGCVHAIDQHWNEYNQVTEIQPWEGLEEDAPVRVWNEGQEPVRGHFSGVNIGGNPMVFAGGSYIAYF